MPGGFSGFSGTSSTEESGGGNRQFPSFGGQGGMTPPAGMEIPEGMENMFPGQNGNSQGSFPSREQTVSSSVQSGNSWGLLAVTVVILGAGLLFASKFKR